MIVRSIVISSLGTRPSEVIIARLAIVLTTKAKSENSDTVDGRSSSIVTSVRRRTAKAVSKPVVVTTIEVEFPLYARALEYCAAHQDSFVRVTAMNICLNTLRLATVVPASESEVNFDENAKSPGGTLNNSQALPLRERLAIAQHVCCPSRVEGLVSPIFTRLAHLWGVIEERIRDIDLLCEGKTNAKDGGPRIKNAKMQKAKEEAKRKRYGYTLRDSIADLQDELLLLEDVFRVSNALITVMLL